MAHYAGLCTFALGGVGTLDTMQPPLIPPGHTYDHLLSLLRPPRTCVLSWLFHRRWKIYEKSPRTATVWTACECARVCVCECVCVSVCALVLVVCHGACDKHILRPTWQRLKHPVRPWGKMFYKKWKTKRKAQNENSQFNCVKCGSSSSINSSISFTRCYRNYCNYIKFWTLPQIA